MVKLIRLASNNDLNFAANFDNDIIVPPGSKLALQNLTFKTEFTSVSINSSNNIVKFTGNIDPSDGQPGYSSLLTPKNYSGSSGFNDFLENIERTLNTTLESNSNQPTYLPNYGHNKDWNVVYGSFKVPTDRAGDDADPMRYDVNSITFRYSILCTPNGPTFGMGFPQGTENQELWEGGPSLELFATDQGVNTVQMAAGIERTAEPINTVICYENIKLSRGNALFMVRVADFRNNGFIVNNNGFTIGVTTTNLVGYQGDDLDPLTDDDRGYEVAFNRESEPYSYSIHNAGVTTTKYPQRVSATTYTNPNEHDIMWCRIDREPNSPHKQILRLGIWQIPQKYYLNLPQGNVWQDSPINSTTTFDETDLGDVATYRMVVASGIGAGTIYWYKHSNNVINYWEVFYTKPVAGSVVDTFAIVEPSTGVITIGGINTLTPAQMPSNVSVPGGDAVEFVLYSKELSEEELDSGFYPYMFVCGASVDVKADMPCFTVDPFMEGNTNNEITGFRDYNISNILHAQDVFNIFPNIDAFGRRKTVHTAELTMHSDVWNYLGMKPRTAKDEDGYQGMNLKIENEDGVSPMQATWLATTESQLDADDNFIVESLTLPLDCYDASDVFYSPKEQQDSSIIVNPETEKKGRRKNILATIPINDNNNGLVQFDTNSPVFIDLKNTDPILLRNLKLRVLRQDFSPVSTGLSNSIMTLLLDTGR